MTFQPYIFISYGLIIVFSGLIFLAIVVSNIHRIIEFFSKLDFKKRILEKKTMRTPPISLRLFSEMENFIILTKNNEGAFSLPGLIYKAKRAGIESPWEIIDIMIKKKVIIPDNQGRFLWNQESACYKKIKNI